MQEQAVHFFERAYPSANSVLLTGHRPVLVDTGFGADAPELLAWLEGQGVPAGSLSLVVNTHSHCDHAGGNHALQSRFDLTVAAGALEAGPVNARSPDACQARWLRQPVEAYSVGRLLEQGDQVGTGDSVWTVLATPGHTAGHLSLHCAEQRALVLGDVLHQEDVGWLNPYREGSDSLDRAEATVELVAALRPRIAFSGHGPAITDPEAAFERARRRLRSWREEPERMAWHACKRIFAYALMLNGGLSEPEIEPFLLACPWFHDHAATFGVTPQAFVPMLLAEMKRADAAYWDDGKLVARAPSHAVPAGWPEGPVCPAKWPVRRKAIRRRRA